MNPTICAIEIATTAVRIVIAEKEQNTLKQILAMKEIEGRFLVNGKINNLNELIELLATMKADLERSFGSTLQSVYVNISGERLGFKNEKQQISINQKDHRISKKDMENLMRKNQLAASHGINAAEFTLIHSLALSYDLDSGENTNEPEGQRSTSLTLYSHHIFVDKNLYNDYEYLFEQVGLQLDGVVFNGLAASFAILSDSEWTEGVLHLNMGASIVSAIACYDRSIFFSGLTLKGGNYLTQRLAHRMNIYTDYMETIKVLNSALQVNQISKSQLPLPFASMDQKNYVNKEPFCQGIKDYCDELIKDLQKLRKDNNGIATYCKRLVLSGGGARIRGLREYMAREMKMDVRLAETIIRQVPAPMQMEAGLRSEKYATLVGMLIYIIEFGKDASLENPEKYDFVHVVKNFFRSFFRGWF